MKIQGKITCNRCYYKSKRLTDDLVGTYGKDEDQ